MSVWECSVNVCFFVVYFEIKLKKRVNDDNGFTILIYSVRPLKPSEGSWAVSQGPPNQLTLKSILKHSVHGGTERGRGEGCRQMRQLSFYI